MVENGEPEVTLAEEDHHGLDGGYQDVDAVIKLLVIDGPEVRDLEACPQRSHVSTLCACSPVLLYAHTHARARAHTHTAGGGETTWRPWTRVDTCLLCLPRLPRFRDGAEAKCGGPSIP